jgi:hypothetical protein
MFRSNPKFSNLLGLIFVIGAFVLSNSAFAIDFFRTNDQHKAVETSITKPQLIVRFKDIQARLNKEVQTVDDSVKKLFQETAGYSLHVQDLSAVDKKLTHVSDQLAALETKRTELTARRDFIDQVIFTVDNKWTAQPLKTFFESQFLDLAFNDFTDARGDGRMWKFMLYLSIAVREVPEPREDVVNVIESYMDFASVLNPKTPTEFLNSRNYTNGSLSVTAKHVDRAALGEYLETRLKELKASKAATAAIDPSKPTPSLTDRPDIELRLSKAPSSKNGKSTTPSTDSSSTSGSTSGSGSSSGATSSKDDSQFYISPMIKSGSE